MRLIDADKLDTRERGNNSQRTMWREIEWLIKNAPTVDVPQWVNVKERLPDCKGEYLVAYHPCYWDNVKEETVVGYDSYRGGARWARNKYQRVTHWMPMPEPPKPH